MSFVRLLVPGHEAGKRQRPLEWEVARDFFGRKVDIGARPRAQREVVP